MKISLIIMLLLFVDDDIQVASVTDHTDEKLIECALEAGALNRIIEQARRLDWEEAVELLNGNGRLRWVDEHEVDDARFECKVVLLEPW